MLSAEFKEALKLMNGKAALLDKDECYIIMTLEEFKKIRKSDVKNLTKQESLDRINSDVDLWKNSEDIKIKEEEKKKEEEEEIKYVR